MLLIGIVLVVILGYSVATNIEINLPTFSLSVIENLIGIHSTANTDHGWNLILVNRDYYIPEDYTVELTELSNGEKVDSRIYPDLQEMFDDARAEGIQLFVADGYRTEETQHRILDEKIEAYKCEGYSASEAEKKAKKDKDKNK